MSPSTAKSRPSAALRVAQRVGLFLLAVLLLLAAVLAANTFRQGSRQLSAPPAPHLAMDEQALAQTLGGAIRQQTIASPTDPQLHAEQFQQLQAWLAERFPRVHRSLQREVMADGLTLLYTWKGSDPAAKPIALMAHQDVVPIAPGTEVRWQVDPFSGAVQDGFVWGRGAWDDKGNLIAQMQAIELLLASGFQPRQTVYLVCGADEEIGGRGAQQVAQRLRERKVRLDFVIDEGLLITEGVMPGLSRPVALVGVAEKGYLTVHLKVETDPGHSSMPSARGTGAISVMSAALRRLDDQQMPAAVRGVAREMFETVAPEMGGLQRVALSNLWLFGPLVQAQLEKAPSTNAMLRTTTALTGVQAGSRANVLPGLAEATVNFRLLPGDTRDAVLQHVRQVAGERVELQPAPGSSDASPVSPTASTSYQLVSRTLRSLFPDTVVAPGLMVGATDSRHLADISDHIYRFSPVRAKPEDLARFHGTNERIAVQNLVELVRFYHLLLTNANASVQP
ncbi:MULTISPECIES: M20 family peptidase [Ramlibacter]|uniref:M20 family peptidase n=1 Tax=Ramlibacter aquaticus TaxID=2780094 RepID=A0ABR9SFH9_9BURK|nr:MULTISPECIES: M20 family peptidase [Ramlibacter]MBE7941073.1 M20 family peptidase [Ramlibacter aquaticus]